MANTLPGLRVVSDNTPDLFDHILGREVYEPLIHETSGDAEKLHRIFWDVLADDYHWEFINGEIILRGGLSTHAALTSQNLRFALWEFHRAHPDSGLILGSRCICTLGDNDFSPYIMYFPPEAADKFTDDQNRFPAPKFIVEVNDNGAESWNRDVKATEYAKHGVEEYWMLNPSSKNIEQYILDGNHFDLKEIVIEGEVQCASIPGFSITHAKIFGDA